MLQSREELFLKGLKVGRIGYQSTRYLAAMLISNTI